MKITIAKIFAIIAILLFLASTIAVISAKEIVWTEHSDSTFTEFETVDQPENQEEQPNSNILEQDLEREDEFRPVEYGQWTCINNQLQRTNTINGAEIVEYGQACGFEEPASEKQIGSFWILPVTLLILIIIALLLIVSVAITRR